VLSVTVTVAVLIARPRTYTAVGSFKPQDSERPGGELAGLAAQFGVSVRSESGESSQFYADLMQTATILGPVAEALYTVPEGTLKLSRILGLRGSDSATTRAVMIARLSAITDVSLDRRTGVVRYRVTTRSPDLSLQIAVRWMNEINSYNVRSRRARTAAERAFTEDRVGVARAELQTAESKLEEFLQRNRVYTNDPRLVFAHDRLQRDVAIREQVFITLAQSLEQISIASARSTPTTAVVEQPDRPAFPDPRGLLIRALIALVAGAVIGVLGAFAREYVFDPAQQDGPELDQLRQRLDEVRADVRHPLRALGSVLRARRANRSA
jgi:uncharacterized protein involved in exopolysaccharide biosynthesis